MKLGILVNTDNNRDHVIGLSRAALAKGHEVIIFNMDDGTKLLGDSSFSELCNLEGVRMSFCEHSAKGLGVDTEGLPKEIACGSQYDNAVMNNEADKLITL